ncbi:Protein LSM12 -like protein A [Toxocara canis]|uniref:Protein LSM12-like protein A n=1 Tax=Toxocara canis TaxID=6265 RepID=A0A0B2VAK8_TOXCA|nr:Protein LSM12 -like protein A [Toxocara canis]
MTAFDANSQGSLAEGSARNNDADVATSDTNIVFPTGSVVECQTALATRITGQVVSYDHPTRLLLIKDTSSGSKPLLRLLNLALVEQVSCVRDRTPEYVPYSSGVATPQQVLERVRRAEARKQASLLDADVSLEGQRIFLYLRKTLEDVKWQNENISVLDRVVVRPPYTADSVETTGDSTNAALLQAKEHVRKILAKYHSVHQPRSSTDDAPADPTPSR